MRALLAVLSFALGCSAPAPSTRTARAADAKPRLVVLIVVDQLPSWSFERDRPLFSHGFARLLRDGAVVPTAEIPYAHPFTAPGHASIATGAPPSVHGVIGNRWYRRAERRARDAEHDAAAPLWVIGPSQGGELDADAGASGRALRVEGIADRLRAAVPGARAVAIGLKPRGAAFLAGRQPDVAVWYEAAAGGMTTSRAYAAERPAWLADLARDRPASRFFAVEWAPRDPAMLARVTGIADGAPGEGAVHGLDAEFPHSLAGSDAPARAFLHTPYGDEVVFDAAIAALSAFELGADDRPDLLALSFNARDYAGHLWGPDSWEALDLTLRLDERLGSFFELLDDKVGRGAWAAVVTSDHGATRVVERSQSSGARRIRSSEITDAAERALAAELGGGPWVTSVLASNVYLTPAFAEQPAAARTAALDAASRALSTLPGIAAAGRVDQVSGDCPARDGLERALCLSMFADASGELYVVPAQGSLISDYRSGTHHDAPFDDNRRVPILVMAPGLAPRNADGTLLQVAPTVAALLGIAPPSAATAPPLFDL